MYIQRFQRQFERKTAQITKGGDGAPKKNKIKEDNILELKKPWYKMERACLSAKRSRSKKNSYKKLQLECT